MDKLKNSEERIARIDHIIRFFNNVEKKESLEKKDMIVYVKYRVTTRKQK